MTALPPNMQTFAAHSPYLLWAKKIEESRGRFVTKGWVLGTEPAGVAFGGHDGDQCRDPLPFPIVITLRTSAGAGGAAI